MSADTNGSPVRIGVIGTGNIAACHLKAYAATPDAELVAVADAFPGRAATVAETWGAARHYDSADALLADPDIDAVSICTPNVTHAPLALAALEAGKHVLVEKPMSRTYAEAAEVQRAAEASDRVLQVGFVRRHSGNCQVLKSYIDAGTLGDVYYAKATCLRRLGNPGGWFANKAISGGGPVIDVGVHVIDLAWYLMGSPQVEAVSATTFRRLGSRDNVRGLGRYRASDFGTEQVNDVEDLASAMIRFAGGKSMIMDVSFTLHATADQLGVSVFGDRGGADLEPLRVATELHDTMVNIEPVLASDRFDLDSAFANEIGNFVGSVRGDVAPLAPAWHGAEIMKILELVYRSAEAGREVAATELG